MLDKWKFILTNWINCYFDNTKSEECMSIETLLTIISHLHKNLNLDESVSSVLQAHTVEDFIIEKYPEFKFENGTVEPTNEEEVYIVASLLLLFVCVNSKDVDIKQAMCNKLSPEDQETIMKFSKCLMECSTITYTDIQAAITEACGQDVAGSKAHATVAETPPALRSLHGDVRRLQAALDAERFDRNYLQEELVRTTTKMEKLLKDKQRYKEEIMELKAKISLCCGHEAEERVYADEGSARLSRQLEDLEERLVVTQEKLEDAQQQRDAYQAKMEQLKQERDKWLTVSQEEITRSGQLTEELELERRRVQSLQELVSELRQHHQNNCLDGSQLECDDPEASMQSLHNASVCSEACANVVEVQLLEERAKIVGLKQQIETLQGQLNELTQKTENERLTLESIISEKDNEISDLKHRINEETEEKNNLTMNYHEKLLNKNNELVELQNKICERGEMIEQLNMELRKEKELNSEISNKFNDDIAQLNEAKTLIERNLFQKTEEAKELQRRLLQSVNVFADLNKEIDDLKLANQELSESYAILQETEQSLVAEMQQRDSDVEGIRKEIENITNIFSEEKNKFMRNLEEKNVTINTLQVRLRDEIHYKTRLENELQLLHNAKMRLSEDVTRLNKELSRFKAELQDKDRMVYALDLYLKEEKHTVKSLKLEKEKINNELAKLTDVVSDRNKEIENLKEELQKRESYTTCYEEDKSKKEYLFRLIVSSTNERLLSEAQEKQLMQKDLELLRQEKDILNNDLIKKNEELVQLQQEFGSLCQANKKNVEVIKTLGYKIEVQTKKYAQLENDFDTQTSHLMAKLNETEKAVKHFSAKSKVDLEEKVLQIQALKIKIDNLNKAAEETIGNLAVAEKEKIDRLNEETSYRNKIEKEYQNQCALMDNITSQLNGEISLKSEQNMCLKNEIEKLLKITNEKSEELKIMEARLVQERESNRNMTDQKNQEIKDWAKKVEELRVFNEELEEELKKEVASKTQAIAALQSENELLHFTIEEDNSNHEVILKEKDIMIERVEQDLKEVTMQLESIRKDYENGTLMWEKSKIDLQEEIKAKNNQLTKLNNHVSELKTSLEYLEGALNALHVKLEQSKVDKVVLEKEKTELLKQNAEIIKQLHHENGSISFLELENKALLERENILTEDLKEEKSLRKVAEQEKQSLLVQKQELEKQLVEESIAISNEKESIVQQVEAEKSTIKLLNEDKECLLESKKSLEQRLTEEIKIKTNLEQERDNLIRDKCDCLEKNHQLTQEIEKEALIKDLLQAKLYKLNHELEQERSSRQKIDDERTNLHDENSNLKHRIVEFNAIQEVLMHDKEVLSLEKDKLVQNLNEEKAARDEFETEKNAVNNTLHKLKEKYTVDLKEKQDELIAVSMELKQVQAELKKHEDITVRMTSILNNGLEKLLQNVKKEEFGSEVLQKLVSPEKDGNATLSEKCNLVMYVAEALTNELSMRRNLGKALEQESTTVKKIKGMITEKEMQVFELQTEVKRLQQVLHDSQTELSKYVEMYNTTIDAKVKDIQMLQVENKSLNFELNNVKVQLEVKVHSLKEKLIENENLTDKLKRTYECQIENLNVMITKLTNYLKEKTMDLETSRKEKDKLQQIVDDKNKVVKSLEEEIKSHKLNHEKLICDFESERQVLKNMMTVTESIMEDQKVSLNKIITDNEKSIEHLKQEKQTLEHLVETTQSKAKELLQQKEIAFETVFKELVELRKEKEALERDMEMKKEWFNKELALLQEQLTAKVHSTELVDVQYKVIKKEKEQFEKEVEREKEELSKDIRNLKEEIKVKVQVIEALENHNKELVSAVQQLKNDLLTLQEEDAELKVRKESLESDLLERIDKLTKVLSDDTAKNDKFKSTLQDKLQSRCAIQEKVKVLTDEIIHLVKEKNQYISKLDEVKTECEVNDIKTKEEIAKLKSENQYLTKVIEEHKTVISNLEQVKKYEMENNQKMRDDNASDILNLETRCSLLQEYQIKAEQQVGEQEQRIAELTKREVRLEQEMEILKERITKKDKMIAQIAAGKDEVINTLNKELMNEKLLREKYQVELECKLATMNELRQKVEEVKSEAEELEALKKENDEMLKSVGHRDMFAACSQDKISSYKYSEHIEKELRDRHQVSTPTSDLTHSSMESFKTITDLEKIINDKNRSITTLQSDITYMKSLMADSENKLLDVTKELQIAKENNEQLSDQLKKLVHQKNEEIADLKKQVAKMSVTETRATQIIKVSAKYQAIILKRIAEIKSNTILKELTNFGNTANCDSELKRNLHTGAITMEDLENFLETTDRHLKRCTEKQVALQKERDRLTEVNRINESEIINMKKFLTEMSVTFKTFSSIKEMYTQKLSRVVSVQRTVRREILNLDGRITDATMCKLERGYAAVMQDLTECTMNLERWVERCIGRTVSAEKIKQAFTSETDRGTLAATSFQNISLEVQLEELEKSFQKLLEETVRAQKGDGAKDPQAVTVKEVQAEYEDKLNRMKAKMKQLYYEQTQVFKEKHNEEISTLERELQKTRDKLVESSRAYEDHIRSLTSELWSVSEKFLMTKDEAEWLKKKQKSGSLISLQHIHSAGLAKNHEVPSSRPSDSYSLRSLPTGPVKRDKRDREGRNLYMSDEEGEVFDNRWLKELSPRRESTAGRLTELRWRNSLCPPHLKSSYPAETQFAQAIDEEELKCPNATASSVGRYQRKEVGITAYKKPGPPTPSKQAGRLSATDSELRESLRLEPEVVPLTRKTSTPSRLRAMFRSSRSDNVEGTPRRRLSNIFRKK